MSKRMILSIIILISINSLVGCKENGNNPDPSLDGDSNDIYDQVEDEAADDEVEELEDQMPSLSNLNSWSVNDLEKWKIKFSIVDNSNVVQPMDYDSRNLYIEPEDEEQRYIWMVRNGKLYNFYLGGCVMYFDARRDFIIDPHCLHNNSLKLRLDYNRYYVQGKTDEGDIYLVVGRWPHHTKFVFDFRDAKKWPINAESL